MKISVIISTRNRADMLENAIKSVQTQTYKNFEIIVIDDISEDHTEEVVKRLASSDNRIKYYKTEKHVGIAVAWKRGFLQYGTGELATVLNDDDYFIDDDFFQDAVALFEKHKDDNLVSVFSNIRVEHLHLSFSSLEYDFQPGLIDGRELFFKSFLFSDNGCIYKRDLIEEIDILNEEIFSKDMELMYKLMLHGKFAYIDRPTYAHVFHDSNDSHLGDHDYGKMYDAVRWFKLVENYALEKGFLTKQEIFDWKHSMMKNVQGHIARMSVNFNDFILHMTKLDKPYWVYGTGVAADMLSECVDSEKIKGFIDDIREGTFKGKPVQRPEDISDDQLVVMAVNKTELIVKILDSLRMKGKKFKIINVLNYK